jgi:hypothetical protein
MALTPKQHEAFIDIWNVMDERGVDEIFIPKSQRWKKVDQPWSDGMLKELETLRLLDVWTVNFIAWGNTGDAQIQYKIKKGPHFDAYASGSFDPKHKCNMNDRYFGFYQVCKLHKRKHTKEEYDARRST